MNAQHQNANAGISNQHAKAMTYYRNADSLAKQANHSINHARETRNKIRYLEDLLSHMDSIINITLVVILTILFFGVAVVEFLISKEIYREISRFDWAIAAAFFGVGILISHFIGYKLAKELRSFLYFERRLNPHNDGKIDEEIEEEVKKESNKNFIIGVILAIIFLTIITWLSYQRVKYEIEAGMRELGYGVEDMLPTFLYLVELFLGIYFIVFVRYMWLKYKLGRARKHFKKSVNEAANLTHRAIEQYQRAEAMNFDPFTLTVSDDIHSAFYRHEVKSVDHPDDYIELPEMVEHSFTLELMDKDKNKVTRHINILTTYKVTDSGTVNDGGPYTFKFKTYKEDKVQFMFVRDTATSKDFKKIEATYDLDNETPEIFIVE